MEFLDKIRDRVQDLEEKDFYKYLLVFFIILILFMGFFVFRFYRNVNYYQRTIEDINEQREDTIRDILNRAEDVEKRRKEVNAILAEDPDFKIIDYFNKLLQQLGLGQADSIDSTLRRLPELKYDEYEITARLTGISTQGLCQFWKNWKKIKELI